MIETIGMSVLCLVVYACAGFAVTVVPPVVKMCDRYPAPGEDTVHIAIWILWPIFLAGAIVAGLWWLRRGPLACWRAARFLGRGAREIHRYHRR